MITEAVTIVAKKEGESGREKGLQKFTMPKSTIMDRRTRSRRRNAMTQEEGAMGEDKRAEMAQEEREQERETDVTKPSDRG